MTPIASLICNTIPINDTVLRKERMLTKLKRVSKAQRSSIQLCFASAHELSKTSPSRQYAHTVKHSVRVLETKRWQLIHKARCHLERRDQVFLEHCFHIALAKPCQHTQSTGEMLWTRSMPVFARTG